MLSEPSRVVGIDPPKEQYVMQEPERLERLAQSLVAAERDRQPLRSQGEAGVRDTSEAYEISQLAWQIRGERAVGYKLGFTSAAMREQMGVPGPNYGRLSVKMELAEPVLDLTELIHPRFEPEIALLVEHDLEGTELTSTDVRSAVSWACCALEVVDSRFRRYEFTPEENTADNSSAARFLLGRWVRLEEFEPRLAGVLTSVNGKPTGSGIGADAMGGPLHALRWLSTFRAGQGKSVEAGSIVLTGGLTRAHPLVEGHAVFAEFAGLGSLHLFCEGRAEAELDEGRH